MFRLSAQFLSRHIQWLSVLLSIWGNQSTLALPLSPSSEIGVVIGQDNAQQWPAISSRLQTLGVDYCVLDVRDWQQEEDLKSLRVLFLPNVSNLTGDQVLSLNKWINNGGKVIVSGPTGKLATPEVQNTLKKVLGAYWGFSVTKPSTLVIKDQKLALNKQELSGTLVGGVVIPADINSQTLAVWMAEGKSPAVVMNEHTTYFGWRWGVDNVTSPAFDNAWLNTALKRYGVNRIPHNVNPYSAKSVQSCPSGQLAQAHPKIAPKTTTNLTTAQGSSQPTPNSPRSLTHTNSTSLQSLTASNQGMVNSPNSNYTSPVSSTVKSEQTVARMSNSSPISAQEVAEMVSELEGLIYRVESALITAEAKDLQYTAPTSEIVEQVLKSQQKKTDKPEFLRFSNKNATQALLNAQQVVQQFPQLVQQNYPQARQAWLDARRNLWDSYPVDRYVAQPEVRAMWLDRGTIVKARSKADLAPIFDRMVESGINTVFFETINASYPIYPSRVAPEQNPLTKGWDPLQAAIELAHERGIELHAWAWIFAAANQGHNQILNQPETYLGPVLSRYPSWVLKDQNGDVFNRTPGFKKAFFDPAHPEVRRYLSALLQEIVANYDVDGVQLDYIRYPFQDSITKQHFGYTAASRHFFKQRYGIDPKKIKPSSPEWKLWQGFRVQQVDSFVAEVAQKLKRQRPDLIISTAVFPMERQQRLATLQQNWEEWLYSEWVDMMVLMTYAMHTGSFAERTKFMSDYSQDVSGLIIPGIRLLNVPNSETLDQMQLLRNMPTNGFALFAAENFNPSLAQIFKRTQGKTTNSTEVVPIPHREPFVTAFARYQNLRQEWNFLLVNHQIIIEPTYLKQWSRSIDLLSDHLHKLANEPSQSNFQTAQAELGKFHQKLAQYLGKHEQNYPLQVKSWQNRLLTLENLLNYGQRTILANSVASSNVVNKE